MSAEIQPKPRVGIPWRTREEELHGNVEKLNHYFEAVRRAGAEPVHISLALGSAELQKRAEALDGFVLPGSPADVDPGRYGAPRHAKTKTIDPDRDRTDNTLLDHAIAAHKPVLAICYGCQILNVRQKGSLIQDIAAERSDRPDPQPHGATDLAAGATKGDQSHDAVLESGSGLAALAGSTQVRINSSHHQAIDRPGEKLRVTARAIDGIIEGVELQSPEQWVVGVQWHPERMPDDPFAQKLFADFVNAARKARLETAAKR